MSRDNKVYILGGLRSHIGVTNGIFKNVLPEKIGAKVLKNLISKYKLDNIDEIICGNTVGAGGNIARLISLYADLPYDIPAYTIDMQCASASACIDIAFSKIKSGQSNLIIVGGVESTSTQPTKSYNKNDYRYNEESNIFSVSKFSPYEIGEDVMIKGAERVAEKEKIRKDELDFWAIESHKRATNARKMEILNDSIISVNNSTYDEGIREKISQRLIDRLKPLVHENGKVNISNTCLKNDGAAFIVLCSEKFIKEHKINHKAEIVESCIVGSNPLYSPGSAEVATDKILEKANLSYSDISAFEYNEAFAVIDVLFQRRNPQLINKYNIFGGALAYGHPYAASGAIIMIHLLKSLEYLDGEYGITSIASAGGLGASILIKRIKDELL